MLLLGHRLNDVLPRNMENEERRLTINGTVDLQGVVDEANGYCSVDATYKIRLSDTGDADELQWIRVPLNLDHALVDVVKPFEARVDACWIIKAHQGEKDNTMEHLCFT